MGYSRTPTPQEAYSRAGLTTPKTRQVVMLYDGIIRNLLQAEEAIASGNPERRTERLLKASEIVLALQSSLDFDAEPGISQTLFDYYSGLDSQIIRILSTQDSEHLAQLIADIRGMRSLWDEVDHEETAKVAARNTPPTDSFSA